MSQLELLPTDLLWMIMEYTPECAANLSLASRNLLARVNQAALMKTAFPFVSEMTFTEMRYTGIKRLEIKFEVPGNKSALFDLRLKHIMPTFTGQIKRFRGSESNGVPSKIYYMSVDWEYEDQGEMDYLRDCTGRRIEKAVIDCERTSLFEAAANLLERYRFEKLKCTFKVLPESIVTPLIGLVKQHAIAQLELHVAVNLAKEPITILLELSSLVSSFKLVQIIDHFNGHMMFGVPGADWAKIVLDMLSETRALNKLCLESRYPIYMTQQAINALKTGLPLINKKIWFSTFCGQNLTQVMNTWQHESVVKVVHDRFLKLTVKHSTREHEPFET